MPKTIQRTVAFYWLRLRSREAVSYRPVEDVDWESRLADLDSMKWQEKAIDGICLSSNKSACRHQLI